MSSLCSSQQMGYVEVPATPVKLPANLERRLNTARQLINDYKIQTSLSDNGSHSIRDSPP